MQLSTSEIRRQVAALGPWFHNIELNGVPTAPDHFLGNYPYVKWRKFAAEIPEDLTGMTVLDVGCNAGFYTIEMKRRGAARVLGIDSQRNLIRQAVFVRDLIGLDIDYRRMSVYDLDPCELGQFDITLALGL